MPTVSEVQTLLSRYAGNGETFLTRLNLVRARLLQSGNWSGTKRQIELTVYSDVSGTSIVTLPSPYKTILAGAIRSENVLCSGQPLGVRNAWNEFNQNGLGYGGLSDNFQEVTGTFCTFQDWEDWMRLRFKFETTEASGTLHLRGLYQGSPVFSLDGTTWIEGEKLTFSGTTAVTSTKYFEATGLSIVKPITNGRVSMYAVDSDGVETLVGVFLPEETVPRWKRYKVPDCSDVSPVTSTTAITPDQYFTKDEILALFEDGGTITVSSSGTHDLVYSAYVSRHVRIVAQAGSGPYSHAFLLDSATVKNGGTLRISLEIAASANPTLNFYDNTASTLRYTVSGDSSNAIYETLVFNFDGTNWNFEGREL